nr:transcriptional repressor CTCFL-like isoform X13 [Onthophagus taurus]
MMGTMSSIKEIMQFCRLCLVKDQVNVSIFEEHGDTRDVKRKISECLPVTVSEEDSLPKKICDGCLYKLELLYQFRTTCVSAEKQLQVWIAELNNSESKEDQDLKLQHSQTSVKEEIFDATDHPDNSEYVIEEQHISYEEGDIPYNESQDDNDDGDATNSSDDEPLAKRRKRFLEEQVQTDDTLKTADNKMAITKLEHESDDENVDDPEPNFVSVGTSDDQQPGPSGLNKMSATTTNAEMPSCEDTKTTLFETFIDDDIVIVCNDINFELDDENDTSHDVLPINTKYVVEEMNNSESIGSKMKVKNNKCKETSPPESTVSITNRVTCERCKCRVKLNETICDDDGIFCKKCYNKSFICEYCDIKCSTNKVLKAHVKEKHYCACCDKHYQFPQKHRVKLHSLRCTVCGELVSSKEDLEKHMGTTHSCSYCKKYYSKIRIHHYKTEPVQCIICKYMICKKSEIRKHYLVHHGRQWCAHCNNTFANTQELFKHTHTHLQNDVVL